MRRRPSPIARGALVLLVATLLAGSVADPATGPAVAQAAGPGGVLDAGALPPPSTACG